MKLSFIRVLIICLTLVSIHTTAFSQQIIKTPDEAAKRLYQAWQNKDRQAAIEVVRNNFEDAVIDKLFRAKRRKMVFKGCQNDECVFYNAKKGITLTMKTNALMLRNGFRVYSIEFSRKTK